MKLRFYSKDTPVKPMIAEGSKIFVLAKAKLCKRTRGKVIAAYKERKP